MAKKKLKVGKIVICTALLLGIAAFCMLFAPQLTGENVSALDGLKITFGYSESGPLGTSVKALNFSFGNFMTYIFILIGLAFAVVALLGKTGKIAPIVSAAAFVLAGVFFFCAYEFTSVYVGDATGDAADLVVKLFKDAYSLGAGAIAGGVLSILGGLAMLGKLFVKK